MTSNHFNSENGTKQQDTNNTVLSLTLYNMEQISILAKDNYKYSTHMQCMVNNSRIYQQPHHRSAMSGVPKAWPHDRATARTTAQLKSWKLSLTSTPDPIRPMRQVLTLTDPRRGHFWKLAITDICCMRGRACIQSYISYINRVCGLAVVRAGFRDTGHISYEWL